MTLEEYRARYGDDDAPGWQAIDAHLAAVYPGVEPHHLATLHKHMLGGPDPLDGISIYRCGSETDWHYHYVSYGFSALYYDEEASQQEYSGFGFELSFRLAPVAGAAEWPTWPCQVMQNLARYVFDSGNWFEDHHWMPANGPICLDAQTEMTGLCIVTDPQLGHIDTPHGKLQFLQLIGITETELTALRDGAATPETLIAALRTTSPLLVTDLARQGSALLTA